MHASLEPFQMMWWTSVVDDTTTALDAAADQLREAGLRATRPRLSVLRVVTANPHATADAVLTAARQELGAVSVQGVYDALAALTAAGLLRRIEPQRHPARYEARTDDNHHHAVCRRCGQVSDVDCVLGQAPCLDPTGPTGLVALEEAEVVFWGLCATCVHEPPDDVA